MTGLQVQARPPVDGRRSLLDVLQFLTDRGAPPEVICLAMARAGIAVEVSRELATLVASTQPALAPIPVAPRYQPDTGRAAELFVRKAFKAAVLTLLFLGAGVAVGFTIGIEIGLAQGFEHGIDQLRQLVSR